MTRIVVLISGRGSNMRAIIEACQNGRLDAEVVAVISNNPDAAGLTFAREQNIKTAVLDHKSFSVRNDFDEQLQALISSFRPDLVAMAGFMRILSKALVNHFLGRMINIHPSLLPLYTGLNTHARVLAAGDTRHGASVHFVTAELDAGPVIAQSEVPVLQNDTEQSLAARVLDTEHELYIQALQHCVSGNARLVNAECYRGTINSNIDTGTSSAERAQNGQQR